MENLGYVTLAEAEKMTGIKIEALKKRCQEGKYAGAIKQGNTWYVPKSELIKVPAPSRDIFLNGLILASNVGVELPITLIVNGVTLGGWLTNIKSYVEQLDNDLFQGLQTAVVAGTGETNVVSEAENRRFVESLLKSPQDRGKSYDELYGDRSKDPVFYDFCYLKNVCKYDGGTAQPLGEKIMRIRVSSIDAYQFGVNHKV